MRFKRLDERTWQCASDRRVKIVTGRVGRYRAYLVRVNKRTVTKAWRLREAKGLARRHWRPSFMPRVTGKSSPQLRALFLAACEGDGVALLAFLDRCEEEGVECDRADVLRGAREHGMVREGTS